MDPLRAERGGPAADDPIPGPRRPPPRAGARRGRGPARVAGRRRAGAGAPRGGGGAEPHRHGAPPRHRRGGARRRDDSIRLLLEADTVPKAVRGAATLLEIAKADSSALTQEREDAERGKALASMGVEPGGSVPPALRGVLRQMEEDQKRRATRGLRDGVDRVLVDLLSVYRDVLMAQLGAGLDPVNATWATEVAALASRTRPTATLACSTPSGTRGAACPRTCRRCSRSRRCSSRRRWREPREAGDRRRARRALRGPARRLRPGPGSRHDEHARHDRRDVGAAAVLRAARRLARLRRRLPLRHGEGAGGLGVARGDADLARPDHAARLR